MKKVRRVSISRGGVKWNKLDIDNETMALLIPKDEEEADRLKKSYQKHLKEKGITIEYQKDIHRKRPFWKFWDKLGDYSIAVLKLRF